MVLVSSCWGIYFLPLISHTGKALTSHSLSLVIETYIDENLIAVVLFEKHTQLLKSSFNCFHVFCAISFYHQCSHPDVNQDT